MKFNLQDVLDNQKKFQEKFGFSAENISLEERVALIHTHASFATEEIFEMLRELPYHKYWVDYSELSSDDLDEKVEAARKEWVDVFIFLMNISVFLDMDAEDILGRYREKQKINLERQENPELGYVNKKNK